MSHGDAAAPAPAPGDLALALHARLGRSVVVMGIGNPDRADDGAGLLVARLIADAAPETAPDVAPEAAPRDALPGGRRVTVLMAEEVPESWVGPASAARPDTVLMVDAADLGAAPGSAALLEPEDLREGAAFTHRTPLALLSTFLRRETGADVFLLAIQPRSVEWGGPMSREVEESARHLGDILASALYREAAAC